MSISIQTKDDTIGRINAMLPQFSAAYLAGLAGVMGRRLQSMSSGQIHTSKFVSPPPGWRGEYDAEDADEPTGQVVSDEPLLIASANAPGDRVKVSVGMRVETCDKDGWCENGIAETITPEECLVRTDEGQLLAFPWDRVMVYASGPAEVTKG